MNNMPVEKNRRVLVIDDNHSIYQDFCKILSPAPATGAASEALEAVVFEKPAETIKQTLFEVDCAYQGQEGVLLVKKALAAGRPYALAFVDMRMPPGWDGVETTRQIRELDPNLQVVLCTAYSDYSWSEMFEKFGQRDGLLILKKPFDAMEAFQMAHALTEKWWLHQESTRKLEELESRVDGRTRELQEANLALQTEVQEHKHAKEELQWKTAFFEAQVNSTMEGILVVDQHGKKILQNPRMTALLKIPQVIADDHDDEKQLRWVTDSTKNPDQFTEKVVYLNSHPNEISRDEIELKDGTVLDRYSSPVVGGGGKYYGRIWSFRDITERKHAENSLRESNEKFHQLADNITDAFWIRSPDLSEVHYLSPAFERIWGRTTASLYANPHEWVDFIAAEDRERVVAAFAGLAGKSPSLDIEYRIVRPDGQNRWVRVRGFQVRDPTGKLIRHTGIVTDITERRRLEIQLFQSQKLETVGKLAGGVAHEFNSILTAIIGQSELLLSDLPPGSPLANNAAEINNAATRAATLTRQLLAYGRKQFLRPENLDLNSVLTGMESTLRHLMGRGVELVVVPGAGLKVVNADAGQIEQVIMNLAMNAADAMPNGGKLMLETANVSLDEDYVSRFHELKAGEYVMLAITDTGTGMSEEIKARVFEPFFTTKDIGEGTGLGLSTCYGILKQSGGHISVYSELARGATFKIYLPQVAPRPKIIIPHRDLPDLPRGTETILLAEDDPALREMAATLLRRLGYVVLVAANGVEALSLNHRRDSEHIDLLFTDVVMPHMNGRELSDRVRALYPHTRILFTSAYTENAIIHQGVLNKGVTLLQKPFTPSALALKVREVLDQPAAAQPYPIQKAFQFPQTGDEMTKPGS
jgi:PAS domain S-box-containing protein